MTTTQAATNAAAKRLTDEQIIDICQKQGLGPCLGIDVGRAIESAVLASLAPAGLETLPKIDMVPLPGGGMTLGESENGPLFWRADVERWAASNASLQARVDALEAARRAYASEFPLVFGEPDVGSIHANIRALKAQLASHAGAFNLERLTEQMGAAMKRAYNLGQTYWQQADSDYASEHKKADATANRFIELTKEICAVIKAAVLASHAGAAAEPVGYVSKDAVRALQAGKATLTAISDTEIIGNDQPLYLAAPSSADVRAATIEEVAKLWDSNGKPTWISKAIRALAAAPATDGEKGGV